MILIKSYDLMSNIAFKKVRFYFSRIRQRWMKVLIKLYDLMNNICIIFFTHLLRANALKIDNGSY